VHGARSLWRTNDCSASGGRTDKGLRSNTRAPAASSVLLSTPRGIEATLFRAETAPESPAMLLMRRRLAIWRKEARVPSPAWDSLTEERGRPSSTAGPEVGVGEVSTRDSAGASGLGETAIACSSPSSANRTMVHRDGVDAGRGSGEDTGGGPAGWRERSPAPVPAPTTMTRPAASSGLAVPPAPERGLGGSHRCGR
jgi:hypothetical protein